MPVFGPLSAFVLANQISSPHRLYPLRPVLQLWRITPGRPWRGAIITTPETGVKFETRVQAVEQAVASPEASVTFSTTR
ncbi:hypothetical protein IG631_07713 [Alternaria alternata]|nr:hypothetical protein IG631_07713 [Alternaria alternata]